MAILYVIARSQETREPLWGWVRSFAEAGMVGALADWFAVVALFRHPLGLPIPHTAIIPRSKEKLASNLARFVEQNFLGPEQIVERLKKHRIAERIVGWLAEKDHAEILADRVADHLPALLDTLDDRHMRSFLRDSVLSVSEQLPLAPLTGQLIDILMESGRHEILLDEGLSMAKKLLHENADLISNRIKVELKILPERSILRSVLTVILTRKVIQTLQQGADEISKNPDHPFRQRYHQKLEEFSRRLRESPEWQEKAEFIKISLLTNPALIDSLDSLWNGVKKELIHRLSEEDESGLQTRMAEFIQNAGQRLQEDTIFQAKLDDWIRSGVSSLVRRHGDEIGNLIRDTMGRWDGKELSEKLEQQVGADLQYIRINGTLVGGLIGLILHWIGGLF